MATLCNQDSLELHKYLSMDNLLNLDKYRTKQLGSKYLGLLGHCHLVKPTSRFNSTYRCRDLLDQSHLLDIKDRIYIIIDHMCISM